MSDKKVLSECESTVLAYDASVILKQLADGLASGALTIGAEGEETAICVAPEVTLEIKLKEKAKDSGLKRSLSIEIDWRVPA